MEKKTTRYDYAVGRRKTSTAVVKLYKWKGEINVMIDWKSVSLKDYFGGHDYLIKDALYPFYVLSNNSINSFDAEIVVRWGGLRWQAESIRLWLTRALVEYNPEFRLTLKPFGLLKRDPRKKERMKPWLKKARKAPQWSKR